MLNQTYEWFRIARYCTKIQTGRKIDKSIEFDTGTSKKVNKTSRFL